MSTAAVTSKEIFMVHELESLDRIHIKDLLLRCIIGINPDEREKKQDVIINVTLYANLAAACESDSIEDTINYKGIKNKIVDLVESSSYFLIEKMVEEIAKVCLEHTDVRAARVLVEKPGALRFTRSVGIEILRKKCDL